MTQESNLKSGDLVLIVREFHPIVQNEQIMRHEGETVSLGVYDEKIYRGHRVRDAVNLRGSATIRGVTFPLVEACENPKDFKHLGSSGQIIIGRDKIISYLSKHDRYSVHVDLVESLGS